MSALRMLLRWNLRMVRIEWRQLSVIAALIALAVAVGVGGVLAAYNLAPPPEQDYGKGSVRATVVGPYLEPQRAFTERFGEIGTVRSAPVAVPGSVVRIEFRSQDPGDAVAAPTIAIVDGRWPETGETAITDEIAERLGVSVGDPLVVEGFSLDIVGLAENPTALSDEFALVVDIDELPIDEAAVETAFLIAASSSAVGEAWAGPMGIEDPGEGLPDVRTLAAIGVSLVFAVGMLQVALLAGAGFAVLSRRRSHQYGLLAVAGATPRQLKWAAGLSGTITGTIGSAIGILVAIVVVAVSVPGMEELVGHRIELAWPRWAVLSGAALGVGAATVAAWWPARGLSRQPVSEILASQRPVSTRPLRGRVIGPIAASLGSAIFLYGMRQQSAWIAVIGVVGAATGVLLLSPVVVKALAHAAGRLPLAVRIAGRSIGRQPGRSAAVVASITVALAIAVSTITATAAFDRREATGPGNLPSNMAIAWLDVSPENSLLALPDTPQSVVRAAEGSLAKLGLEVVPIVMAIDPQAETESAEFTRSGPAAAVLPEVVLQRITSGSADYEFAFGEVDESGAAVAYRPSSLWVGTQAMLEIWDVELNGAPAVARWDNTILLSDGGVDPELRTQVVTTKGLPEYESIGSGFISPETVAIKGLSPRTVGWLLVADGEISPAQRTELRTDLASHVILEFRNPPTSTAGFRTGATIILSLVGLVILLTAIALTRLEAAGELSVLSAIGAGSRTLRSVTSATAMMLAAGAVVLAIPLGFLAQLGLLIRQDAGFSLTIPWLQLLVVMVVFPALGAILAGVRRESSVIRTGAS